MRFKIYFLITLLFTIIILLTYNFFHVQNVEIIGKAIRITSESEFNE